MSLTQKVNSMRPLAVCGVTSWHGIGIFEMTGDYAITAFYNGSEYIRPRRHRFYCTPAGRPFLRLKGCRYYLDEFIRTERMV